MLKKVKDLTDTEIHLLCKNSKECKGVCGLSVENEKGKEFCGSAMVERYQTAQKEYNAYKDFFEREIEVDE